MSVTPEQMKMSYSRMVAAFCLPNFYITAVRCYACRKTANVGGGLGAWECPCGASGSMNHDEIQRPHEKPDYGPTLAEITVASEEALVIPSISLQKVITDAVLDAQFRENVGEGESVLLVWKGEFTEAQAEVVTPRRVESGQVTLLQIGDHLFGSGAIDIRISPSTLKMKLARIATKRYAAILLHCIKWLTQEERERFFSLIRPGEQLPPVAAALAELLPPADPPSRQTSAYWYCGCGYQNCGGATCGRCRRGRRSLSATES